jgi:prepilin peptidase CpaA
MGTESWPLAATCALLLYACWTDWSSFRIPNWISLSVAGLFPVLGVGANMSTEAVLAGHLAAGALILLLGMPLFAMGKIGGGDLKLLAAVSVWFGWSNLLAALFWIAAIGAAMCMLLLVLRESWIPLWLEAGGIRSAALERGRGAPYAIAIAAGFILVEFASFPVS